MPAVTAIELGADTCVLVQARVRGTDVQVGRVEILDPAAFPGADAFSGALRKIRRTHRLPRHARVVLWGSPEGAWPKDPAVAPRLEPLVDAGFKIDRVVSPVNALAVLSRVRIPREHGAVAWIAVNRRNVALAVVRPGMLLFSREFEWDSTVGAIGSQARMLQRYSLVAFLAPEVRRGIDAARAKDSRVDAVVICGNLPDLRSLTMPLIEELDLEVETLDSFDGLTVKASIKDSLPESAPAIRIACAGAVARATRTGRRAPAPAKRGRVLAVAALAVIAAGGMGWFWWTHRAPAPPAKAATQAVPAAPRQPATRPQPAPPAAATTQTSAAAPPPQKPAAPPPAQTPAAKSSAPPATPPPSVPPTATPPATRPSASPSRPAPEAPLRSEPSRTDKVDARQVPPERLTDPLPRVTTILVSQERKFAMLEGGRVISVGDTVGPRVVADIEPRAVVLREPSGVQIRVGLGGRLIGVVKGRK